MIASNLQLCTRILNHSVQKKRILNQLMCFLIKKISVGVAEFRLVELMPSSSITLDALDHCFLCDQEQETIDHIITSCSFSRQVWWNILATLGADASLVGGDTLLSW
jgi:hypothetical protein